MIRAADPDLVGELGPRRGRKPQPRDWPVCSSCGRPVITQKLHGRPMPKMHADCYDAKRARRWDDDGKDLSDDEIERLIAEADAAQKIARRRTSDR